MPKFRKKPVVIEAVQFNELRDPALVAFLDGTQTIGVDDYEDTHLEIPTLEGVMRADVGDWIIKGVKGEFYPCKPDIFAATYEAVDEQRAILEEAATHRDCPTHDGKHCYACEEMWDGKGVCHEHHSNTAGNARAMADLPRR